MTELTRRRDHHADREKWNILYGDVRIGSIGLRAGVPNHADQWEWSCGFYPGCDPGQHSSGPAGTFDLARAAFEAAWEQLLPTRTEADFQSWRDTSFPKSASRPCGTKSESCLLNSRPR